MIRDKKSGNSYSAAGDDDINDVAAMGGVNLQEEANVRFFIIQQDYLITLEKVPYNNVLILTWLLIKDSASRKSLAPRTMSAL